MLNVLGGDEVDEDPVGLRDEGRKVQALVGEKGGGFLEIEGSRRRAGVGVMYSDTGTLFLWSAAEAVPTSLESVSLRPVTTVYVQPTKEVAEDGAKNLVVETQRSTSSQLCAGS